MKIAIYKDTFANNRGADIAVKNLAAGLGERGHKVTLFDKMQFAEKVRGDYDAIISTGTNEILDLAEVEGLPPIIQQFQTDPAYPFRHWIKRWRRNRAIKATLKKAKEESALAKRIKSCKLEGRILLKGYADLTEAYSICAFVAFPSKAEGIPLSVIEAAMFSKPLLMIRDWVGCGEVVPPKQYASALRKLIEDEEYRRSLGERSLAFCKEHYSREVLLNKWEELL